MRKKEPSLPEQRNYEYALTEAYKIAGERLNNADVQDVCRRSGAAHRDTATQKIISLKYLGQSYHITLPGIEVLPADNREKISQREKILILHYLTWAKDNPLTQKQITFKELPEGMSYFPTFYKRTIKPLVDYFGREPDRLPQVTDKFGGRRANYGDVSVTLSAFPHVPITLVLWRGDTELTPSGSILFDSSITDYLPTEDIIVLSETITWKLVRALRQG
ncbi:MAG: DUF3786 domain-containing protein [Chloroflexota bacterium]